VITGLAMTMETIWTTKNNTNIQEFVFKFHACVHTSGDWNKDDNIVCPSTSPQLKNPTFLELILSYTHAKIIIKIPQNNPFTYSPSNGTICTPTLLSNTHFISLQIQDFYL